jgi:hypothetical protein
VVSAADSHTHLAKKISHGDVRKTPLYLFVATEKGDVFAGNPASNVRVVGVYLGTFRGHVFTTERYAA